MNARCCARQDGGVKRERASDCRPGLPRHAVSIATTRSRTHARLAGRVQVGKRAKTRTPLLFDRNGVSCTASSSSLHCCAVDCDDGRSRADALTSPVVRYACLARRTASPLPGELSVQPFGSPRVRASVPDVNRHCTTVVQTKFGDVDEERSAQLVRRAGGGELAATHRVRPRSQVSPGCTQCRQCRGHPVCAIVA